VAIATGAVVAVARGAALVATATGAPLAASRGASLVATAAGTAMAVQRGALLAAATGVAVALAVAVARGAALLAAATGVAVAVAVARAGAASPATGGISTRNFSYPVTSNAHESRQNRKVKVHDGLWELDFGSLQRRLLHVEENVTCRTDEDISALALRLPRARFSSTSWRHRRRRALCLYDGRGQRGVA